MKQLLLLLVLVSAYSVAQVGRVEPQNFSGIYYFGVSGSFNDNEIALRGYEGALPGGIPKIYLFNMASQITPNGSLSSPETNQFFGGGIEMTNDYLFIGSMENNSNVTQGGAVYVYKKVNNNWQYLLKLEPPAQSENDRFGSNIIFYENQLFVTAPGYDSNGSSTVYNGGVYVYYMQNDTFSFTQLMTGNPADFGFGDVLDVENNVLVTTSDGTTTDSVYTYNYGNVTWQLSNTMQMPVFNANNVTVEASQRVSFSDGKLYLYHYVETATSPLTEGKMVKIYNWSDAQTQWDFSEDFSFMQGDYLEYKVKVKGNNMYLIPVGWYILLMERKNPVFHFRFNGTSWNYHDGYTGMSSVDNDHFGRFTVAKGNKALFGNWSEQWINPFSPRNGGAYLLDTTLDTDEFNNQGMVLFPNPTNGTISIASNGTELTQIEVFDSVGKSILVQDSNFDSIDLSLLSSGIYLCKITNSSGQSQFKKVIKN